MVVTSPLRRCLQKTMLAFAPRIESGELRTVVHPDLQEVSTHLCDTGNPLDFLRQEFPLLEFHDELFPDVWPRSSEVRMEKIDSIYDNKPELLASRAQRIQDQEIVVVTHASFAHFLFNQWDGMPDASLSNGTQLGHGEALSVTLPAKQLPSLDFEFSSHMEMDPTWDLSILRTGKSNIRILKFI